MSVYADFRLAQFQEATGIKPVRGKDAEYLDTLQRLAVELLTLIPLERSGIRDGDGKWHGSVVRDIFETVYPDERAAA